MTARLAVAATVATASWAMLAALLAGWFSG
jgi:hypothetical protein